MRRYLIILSALLLVLLVTCRPEEKLEPSDVNTYIKLIGDESFPLSAVDATMDNDGNVILLANVESEEDGNFTFTPMIIRVDKNGNLIGDKEGLFNGTGDISTSMISHSLTRINDNSYLIVGEVIEDETSYVAMVKYSVISGFEGPFRIAVNGSPIEGVAKTSLVLDLTGNYFVIGINDLNSMVFEFDDSSLDASTMTANIVSDDMYLFTQDGKSDILKQSFQGASTPTIPGIISWGGQSSNKAGVSKFNPDLDFRGVDNLFTYPLDLTEITFTAMLQNSSEYIIAGTVAPESDETRTDVKIYSADQNTNLKYELPNPEIINRSGNETPVSIANGNNGFVLLGITEEGNGEEDFVLMKFTKELGTTELSVDFVQNFGGENADIPKTVLHDSDGGFIMYGYTEFSDVNTLLLIKCDKNGGL